MKTRTYKTLSGLIRYNCIRQFTFDDFILLKNENRLYNYNLNKTIKASIDQKLIDEISKMFANAICSKKTSDRYAKKIADYNGKRFGIYTRLWIERNKEGKIYTEYCAGQDYTGEIRCLQNCIRNN